MAILIHLLNMKPLSVEMACLLGIQNKIQAVCMYYDDSFVGIFNDFAVNATPLVCFLIY